MKFMIRPQAVLVVSIALGTIGVMRVQAQPEAPAGSVEPLCGPRCVAFILLHFGLSADGERILKETAYSATDGTTLLSLQRCAEQHGLQCLAVRGSLSEVSRMLSADVLAILHEGNHFVVLTKQGESLLRVDPSFGVAAPVDPERLALEGTVLLMSHGPALVLCPSSAERARGLTRMVIRICLGVVLAGYLCWVLYGYVTHVRKPLAAAG